MQRLDTALHEVALRTAGQIGKVNVNVGDTACKVPLATAYIAKVEDFLNSKNFISSTYKSA